MASLGGHDVFAILLIGLGKTFFWVTQQCIPALCGAMTRISCRPLQPLETSSCYQVAQLAAKDLIDLFWMWYTNSLSNPFPSVFPSIFSFFFLFIPNYSKVLFTRYSVFLQQTQQNGEMYHLASHALVSTGWVQRSKILLIRLQCTALAVSWHLE